MDKQIFKNDLYYYYYIPVAIIYFKYVFIKVNSSSNVNYLFSEILAEIAAQYYLKKVSKIQCFFRRYSAGLTHWCTTSAKLQVAIGNAIISEP